MKYLYEDSDLFNNPFQCFYYNSEWCTFPIAPHWHYYMELLYILNGAAEVHIDGVKYIAKKGEVVVIHPQAVHAIYKDKEKENEALVYAVLKMDMNRMTLSSYYSPKIKSIFKLARHKKTAVVIDEQAAKDMMLEAIFHRCCYESEKKDYSYDMIILSELYKLMIMIIRFWQDRGFVIDEAAYADDDSHDIYSITKYIDENMNKALKVSEIAEQCGMSYSYFAKRFQSVYGKSCKEYIEDMRIYKVEELLVYTDFDLSYISQLTGFSDCSHMIKSFKERKKMTPKKFRSEYVRVAADGTSAGRAPADFPEELKHLT